ncbi:MAG TPA: TatD family hydrolase [Bacteroidales bacterium]|nr:TatD family hydrolase [Bacteroidales bacterium]
MNHPSPGDFIDIHNHGSIISQGHFCVENLMAHEKRIPDSRKGITYSFGIHPWHLDNLTYEEDISLVKLFSAHDNVIAIGESGFDRLKGPGRDFQGKAFEEQVRISEEAGKPLFIHCVRAWDDLLEMHRDTRPVVPWIIHGFRGKPELARQVVSRGMYISFWFDFIIRPESSALVKSLPADRIFLETDGSGADIGEIYTKVSSDLGIDLNDLKRQIYNNYTGLFG